MQVLRSLQGIRCSCPSCCVLTCSSWTGDVKFLGYKARHTTLRSKIASPLWKTKEYLKSFIPPYFINLLTGDFLREDIMKLQEQRNRLMLQYLQDICKVMPLRRENSAYQHHVGNTPLSITEAQEDLGVTRQPVMEKSLTITGEGLISSTSCDVHQT